MPFGRKSPLEALALPGVILAYKYSQFRQRRREAASRRVTERELAALHHKIDKLLSKLEETEPDPPTSQEDECVICINARATMQTSPCGHRVVCRRCFVKTIQSAVAQRLLPLRCVICRARVNRLTSSSGTWRIQESASSYSMGGKSWVSAGVPAGGVPASASAYTIGDMRSGSVAAHANGQSHHNHHHHHFQHGGSGRYTRSPNGRVTAVAQSASLYSMSSTGSSSLSAMSHVSSSGFSKASSLSSGLSSSPGSPISPAVHVYTQTAAVLNNHLAPPPQTNGSGSISPHHLSSGSSSSNNNNTTSPSSSGGSAASLSPRDHHHTLHAHHHGSGCPSGCSGAVPRKPLHSLSNSSSSGSCSSAGSGSGNGVTNGGGYSPTTHTYPGRRLAKGRLLDLQNRLPPIKEFRSPAKVPHPSPVHISNPRFRYASYTKSNTHEMTQLSREPPSPPRRPMNIQLTTTTSLTLAPPPLKAAGAGSGAKICPLTAKSAMPKHAYLATPNDNKKAKGGSIKCATLPVAIGGGGGGGANKKSLHDTNTNAITSSGGGGGGGGGSGGVALSMKSPRPQKQQHQQPQPQQQQHTNSSSRSFPLFSSNNHKEKADNKKNESVERKKKEDKMKLKAEKEARKEEKRLAKEEERLAKLLAKEEKKKCKKEAKELLLANDGNNKK